MNPKSVLRSKWFWIGLALLAFLGLGWVISPRDPANHPILLLPNAKAVEDYRASIKNWREQMLVIDAEISTTLSGEFGTDLFTKSTVAQKAMDEAIQLVQEVDRSSTPTAAIPAKNLVLQAASAYLNASRAMLDWVTAPSDDNLIQAQQSLDLARAALSELEQSEWISK